MDLIKSISYLYEMINDELNIKVKTFWDNLSIDDRIKILSNYQFWDGFSHYKYEYIPEDLKTILMLKIECNELKKDF